MNSFRDIIAPITKDEFFLKYWGNEFLHIPGGEKDFYKLLPWTQLNKILSEHRLDSPRLRISKGGKTVSPEEYTQYYVSRRGGRTPQIITESLNKILSEGATLIIDAVDELYSPIKLLAKNIEYYVNEPVQANAYISWGNTSGFNTHWDDHDVIIIQVSGKKNWFIYGETRKYPLYRDVKIETEAPRDLIWEKTIQPGDLLYIPRGWWHDAMASDEPSVHLTFGITNRNGINLFNWLSEKLIEDDFFRMDIPYLKNDSHLKSYLNNFKEELHKHIDNLNFEDYINDYNQAAPIRTYFSLPHSVYKGFELDESLTVSLSISRKIDFIVDEDQLLFRANSKNWVFSVQVEPLFKLISSGESCTLKEIKSACSTIPSSDIDLFIKELLSEGIIHIT